MKELLLKYKTALLFVLKFIAFYALMNLAYAFYVESYHPQPDAITAWVTRQTSSVLNLFQQNTQVQPSTGKPNVLINNPEFGDILSVYEGCNGLNVIIIFLAFLLAFKWNPNNWWFIPIGIVLIHIANITRIVLLYAVSTRLPDFMYFSHKYLFTASIFIVVFALWFWWIKRIQPVS